MTQQLHWSMAGKERRPLLPAMLVLSAFFCSEAAWAQGGSFGIDDTVGNFPVVAFPPGNPPTRAKIELGKALFFEEQLSSDNTMACATCHLSEFGGAAPSSTATAPGADGQFGTADDIFGSPGMVAQDRNSDYVHNSFHGFDRQVTNRTAPSVIGAAFFSFLLWDMSAGPQFRDLQGNIVLPQTATLESQAVLPFLSSVEMAHADRTWDQITNKLASVRPLALASDIPASLSHFLRDSVSYQELFERAFGTPGITRERIAMAIASYERVLVADQTPFDLGTMSPAQIRGLNVFLTRGFCASCHRISNRLFSDGRPHNIALPNHLRAVKTPSLRNVGLRKRFMHSGQFSSLEQVLQHYKNITFFEPASAAEEQDLIAFLSAGLTDHRVLNRQAPFDRPTLNSERQPMHSNLYGKGSAGTGGVTPIMIAHAPANVGNADFKVGIGKALGGSIAILGASHAALPVGTNVGGIPVLIDQFEGSAVVLPLAAPGSSGATATFKLPIAADQSLAGAEVFTQWFVLDPNAVGGVATTRAARFLAF